MESKFENISIIQEANVMIYNYEISKVISQFWFNILIWFWTKNSLLKVIKILKIHIF